MAIPRTALSASRVMTAKTREGQPDAPVFEQQGDQDAEQQQDVAQHADHQLREEVGQLGHIAVDALDQLARADVVVIAHVQVQAVARHLGAQGVGGRPGHVFAHVGGADPHHLLDQGNADECQGRQQQGCGAPCWSGWCR